MLDCYTFYMLQILPFQHASKCEMFPDYVLAGVDV